MGDRAGPQASASARHVSEEDLVIQRPVALIGERGATLEGTGGGTVVTIETDDASVENLAIRHSGRRSTTEDAGIEAKGERIRVVDVRVDDTLFGVTLQACHGCTLERVRVEGTRDDAELRGDGIKLWESHDSIVRGCVVDHARDVVVWYTRRALVEGNVVRHGRYGTHFMYAHDSIARRNRIEDNVVGIFCMYSFRLTIEDNVLAGARGAAGMGIGFKESDAVQLRGDWSSPNTTGVYLDYSPRTPAQPLVFEGNVFALNDVALRLHSVEKGAIFHGNDFRDNDATIEVDRGRGRARVRHSRQPLQRLRGLRPERGRPRRRPAPRERPVERAGRRASRAEILPRHDGDAPGRCRGACRARAREPSAARGQGAARSFAGGCTP